MCKVNLLIIILIILCNMVFAIGLQEDKREIIALKIGVFDEIETAILAISKSKNFKVKFPNIMLKYQYNNLIEHHNRLFSQLESGEEMNDIEVIEFKYIPHLAQTGSFTDLRKEPFNGKDVGIKLIKASISAATLEDGRIIAFPVSIDPAVLYYRKSIVEKAGISLEKLSSWDEYIDKAVKLTSDNNNDGKIDQYALTHPFDVSVLLLNSEQNRWILNGDPPQPNEKFKSVLSICKKIHDSGIDADFLPWTGKWITSFRDGTVVTMLSGASFGNGLKDWMAPVSSGDGDWRVTIPPQKTYALLGGYYLGIPENIDGERKKLAWEVIKYLCTESEAQLLLFRTSEIIPALVTLYDLPIMSEPVPYFGGQRIYQIFKVIANNIPSKYVSVNEANAIDIFNYAIKSVVYDDESVDEAYIKAKKKINKLVLK